jgi:hypothetical protein
VNGMGHDAGDWPVWRRPGDVCSFSLGFVSTFGVRPACAHREEPLRFGVSDLAASLTALSSRGEQATSAGRNGAP